MRGQAAVVIVGGGIVGCSVAYHLAEQGVDGIVVLEQGPLFETGSSTSHAPGLIFQTNFSRMMTALARETVALYSGLTLHGQPCFHPVGSLEVATTPARWADLHRKWGVARAWGLEAELLTPAAAGARLPLLDTGMIHGAFAVPSDGIARAVWAAEALARAAQARGATFHAHTPVTAIDVAGGQVQAVITPAGRIVAERVVICAGIWGPRVGRLAGVTIPLTPVQHQYARTTRLAELAGERRAVVHPILRHQDRALYFRQHADCYGVGSYQHEPLLVEPEAIPDHAATARPASLPFTEEHFVHPWADAVALLPALGRVRPAERFNGLFSFTPDGLPLLGETAVRGLWVAEAVWITHAGGVGKVLAEWMTGGVPRIDLREGDLNRFEPPALSPAYVRTRGAQQYREVYDIIHPLQQLEQPRPLRLSPFYLRQEQLGAVFFESRGWERPQWYAANEALLSEYAADLPPPRTGWAARGWSPICGGEHLAARAQVALVDLCSLGKVVVSGPGALGFLQRLTTNQVERPIGSVTYTVMVDARGGIISDITVTRLRESRFQLGTNGPLDLAWLRRHRPADGSVAIDDVTSTRCCLGVWGPRARELVAPLSDADLSARAFPYLTARPLFIGEVPVLAQRVSYVGEPGWELYTTPDYGLRLWDRLWEAGQPLGVIAVGRGAVESLRLEKGYRLSGVDVHSEVNPYEAGLGFTVKLDKGEFIGRAALARTAEEGVARRLCCLAFDDPMAVALGKEPILDGRQVLGYVTSATYGYSVGQSLAYGYLPAAYTAAGTRVEIEYFGRRHRATVATEPRFDPGGRRLRP